jgi:hypothetical protein
MGWAFFQCVVILFVHTVFREVEVQVWVLKRREGGTYLSEPARVGGTPTPFELLVVEGTDQGKRRPLGVARLYAPGTKSIIAELTSVQLLWLQGFEFILHGIEVSADARGPIHSA